MGANAWLHSAGSVATADSLFEFAHLQRCTGFTIDGQYVRATCSRGKSRKMGTRPPILWACPHSFLGFDQVFKQAIKVYQELLRQFPDAKFVVPDIDVGPDGPSEATSWMPRKMSLLKSVRILQAVLRRAGAAEAEVSHVSSYSLRRFLPSLADACRCPDDLALHLGNWSESTGGAKVRSQMHHHYADDKLRTAADTKDRLLKTLREASPLLGTESFSWQSTREFKLTWQAEPSGSSQTLQSVPLEDDHSRAPCLPRRIQFF